MHERLEAAAQRAVQQLDETFAAAAQRDPGRVDIRLHELVADVVGVIDLDLSAAGGRVTTNLARGHVTSEPGVLRQVLLNLLGNALKYRRAEEPPVVHVSSRVRGAGVEITVTDNGTGIPAGQLEHVFARGIRLDPGRADGRGHGLADSRQLAESLGGSLVAEPWADGARFVLWVPDPSVAGAQDTTRVVLVVHDAEQLVLLAHRLDLRGAIDVVGTASTLAEAETVVRDQQPDVVLLDRWLGDRDGLDGVQAIARAHRDARIVMLVGAEGTVTDDVARSAGVLRTVDRREDDDLLAGSIMGTPG